MPVASTIASHLDGVSDSARARELYKYYQPNTPCNNPLPGPQPEPPRSPSSDDSQEDGREIKVKSSVTSSKISSPDTALTAFCQLTTWRIGAQRAMISVIDAETQYFIAEGTKTVDLVDNTQHEPGDDIWIGCAAVSKVGRLCERTIAVKPTTGEFPCFIVDDLSKDERFDSLPFVTGPPFLRYYAGVPLITKRGIPIGSLFVVDDRPGQGLSREKTHFMGTMAVTIMRHMEMVREVEEHRRGMKMSRGLASFVEGRAELAEADLDAEDSGEGTKIVGQFETDPSIIKPPKSKGSGRSISSYLTTHTATDRKEKEYSAALSKTEELIFGAAETEVQSSRPDLDQQSQHTSYTGTSVSISSPNDTQEKSTPSPGDDQSESTSMRLLFSRAANLIREAFEVDGGVVFYDAQTGFSSDMGQKPDQNDDGSSYTESATDSMAESQRVGELDGFASEEEQQQHRKLPSPPIFPPGGDTPTGFGEASFSRTTSNARKSCEVLGFSTGNAASIHGDPVPGPDALKLLEEQTLIALLKRYPRGKLWTFDLEGSVSSSSDDERTKPLSKDPLERSKDARRRRLRSAKNKADARILARHFPGVRQLLFIPLWDAGASRWLSTCFAWSLEPTRILSKQGELAFLSAFGNSVMAEWSRIDTEIADKKKSDFIGSISHELRSPLHGILASAEFLEESTTGWERGLVETIDSCGRTLLDTINHILDYSKINHFESNWRRSKRALLASRGQGRSGGALSLQQSDLPMLNLFQQIDISVLCEEVVESVFAGHVFQHSTSQSFDQVPNAQDKMADTRNAPVSASEQISSLQKQQSSGVVVILDVEPHNYHFTTQPGALRRLIMNLLGNALKYTSHGYVKITLSSSDAAESAPSGSTSGSASTGEHGLRSSISLIVQDTGRGISPEFLRSKLFMPFAQENSLSSGTGLGLSIVRKIVSLLEGDITIDSEVGRGTRVRVTLPLLREMPKVDSGASSSTQKSVMSVTKESDDTIHSLQAQVVGYRVALHGFDLETKDPVLKEMGRLEKSSITTFLAKWYGMRVVPFGQKCDIIISNEGSPSTISALAHQTSLRQKKSPAIVVLCSHSSRFDRSMSVSDDCNISFIAKPLGPLKLAKAISQCLPGAPINSTPRQEGSSAPVAESTDLSNVFEELSMSPHGGEVLDNSRMAADSANARKALESPTPSAVLEKHAEFPFPQPEEKQTSAKLARKSGEENSPPFLRPEVPRVHSTEVVPADQTIEISKTSTQVSPETKPKLDSPTLLLVDDNQINLRLLSTYLNRRNYSVVHQAMDGLQAVQKVDARPEGYDIIFMDITMPVLDGFGATRQIRAIEEKRRRGSMPTTPEGLAVVETRAGNEAGGHGHPALIIAFTGRSSIEDQTEAVRVGIDLFMTKPVAFKEVGKIIDNWVANREKERKSSVTEA